MNLASRCREAISHVAMLQKELAFHQERAVESLALQREQNQRMASNLSEVAKLETSSNMDKILSTIHPPPPPPPRLQIKSLLNTDSSSTASTSPASESSSKAQDSENDWDEGAMEKPEDRLGSPVIVDAIEESKNVKVKKTEKPPKVFSTPKKRVSPKNSTPQDKSVTNTNETAPFFPYSASPKSVTPRSKTYEDEFPSDIVEKSKLSKSLKENVVVSVGNIDAFEASFDTAFPDSFSPSEESQHSIENSEDSPTLNGVYNPFFNSPDRSGSQSKIVESDDSSPKTPEIQPKDEKTPWQEKYNTPPRDVLRAVSPSSEPKRPGKTPSAEARAKYDKVLQPKKREDSETDISSDLPNENQPKEANMLPAKTSPSPLLKRIHQKRMNQRLNSASDTKNPIASPEIISKQQSSPEAELRTPEPVLVQHDTSLAKSEVGEPLVETPGKVSVLAAISRINSQVESRKTKAAQLHALKNRRSVKQPISYAEPALNTKLRQGDTYFQKAVSPGQES